MPNFTEAVRLGLIDLRTGMYHDPHTGRKLFLADAVKQGLIDTTGEMPLVGDDISAYTLSQAIEHGIFDEETGTVFFRSVARFKSERKQEMDFVFWTKNLV